MARRPFRIYLFDIKEEIAGIRRLTRHADAASFAEDWAMKRAVQHALLIIAEAAKHLPEDLKAAYAEVPWRQIHGLGNLLRHEYRRIDPEILWSVVAEHLATLDAAVTSILDEGAS